MSKLNIEYHSICKRFGGFSKYESSSMFCTVFDVQSCNAIICYLYSIKFMCCVSKSITVLDVVCLVVVCSTVQEYGVLGCAHCM